MDNKSDATEITLHQVPLMHLREKILGYKLLFGRTPILEITGTFKDGNDEIFAFTSGPNPMWKQADPEDTDLTRLTVVVDGDWIKLTPFSDVIGAIRLS